MADTPKFTPGPWHYTDDGDDEPIFHIGFTLNEGRYRDTPAGRVFTPATHSFARLHAKMRGSHGDTRWQNGELEANARLIAAAPDLYEALKAFADHFGPFEDNYMLHDDCRRCLRLARDAFAKAEGRS